MHTRLVSLNVGAITHHAEFGYLSACSESQLAPTHVLPNPRPDISSQVDQSRSGTNPSLWHWHAAMWNCSPFLPTIVCANPWRGSSGGSCLYLACFRQSRMRCRALAAASSRRSFFLRPISQLSQPTGRPIASSFTAACATWVAFLLYQ